MPGKIRVPTCDEIAAECARSPATTCSISKPKTDKEYQGCAYFPHRFVLNGESSQVFRLGDDDTITIMRDMADRNDKTDDRSGYKMAAETTIAKASSLGKMLSAYNPIWTDKVMSLNDDYKFKIGDNKGDRTIGTYVHSFTYKNGDRAGEEVEPENRSVRILIKPFEMHTHHFNKKMIGQPKTQIFDYTTRKVQPDGRVTYDAVTIDGKPLSNDNIHLVFMRGTTIHKARFVSGSVMRSKAYVSPELMAETLYITVASRDYDDDEEYADPEEIANDVAAEVTGAANVEEEEEEPVVNADMDNMLDELTS